MPKFFPFVGEGDFRKGCQRPLHECRGDAMTCIEAHRSLEPLTVFVCIKEPNPTQSQGHWHNASGANSVGDAKANDGNKSARTRLQVLMAFPFTSQRVRIRFSPTQWE